LTGSKIGGDLNLGGGKFRQYFDLTNAHIEGEIRFNPSDPDSSTSNTEWNKPAKLIFRNATIEKLPHYSNPWPDQVDLEGLSYRSISVAWEDGNDGKGQTSQSPSEWIERMMGPKAAETRFSVQPYEQLASVLAAHGQMEAANAVHYAAKERERARAGWWTWVGMTVLKWSIGYGYYVQRAIYILAGFLLLGVVVLWISGEAARNGLRWGGAEYSLDMLLPLIRLQERHYSNVELQGWPRLYFDAHKIMGYVLVSLLVAGLTLTAK
jgi:hypothetical protein